MAISNRGFFYKRISVTNIAYPSAPSVKLPFQATRVIIAHRNLKANEVISFSFQSPTEPLDGELFSDDVPLTMDGLSEGRLWFKTSQVQNASAEVRVWAWRGGGN